MLTVRNLRPQPTKLDRLRANASSIAALFLWACAIAMLAEVGQPDGDHEHSVTTAEGAMFFSRAAGESEGQADAVLPNLAFDRIDGDVEPPTYEKN